LRVQGSGFRVEGAGFRVQGGLRGTYPIPAEASRGGLGERPLARPFDQLERPVARLSFA
jgi:hypothetical protein